MQAPADDTEFLRQLFHEHVPEVANGTVEIKGVARERGNQSVLLVQSQDSSIDPVNACVGPRGQVAKPILAKLAGEKVHVFRWPQPVEALIRSLFGRAVNRIEVDAASHRATVTLDASQWEAAQHSFYLKALKAAGWELELLRSN